MTLVEFLRARQDEAEAVVQRNLGDDGVGNDGSWPDYRTYDGEDINAACDYLYHFRPPRELAEIAVKREIIRCYEEMVERRDHFRELGFNTGATEAALESYEHVLRCWAQQHDDHPDYSTDWWPEWGPMRPREVQPS